MFGRFAARTLSERDPKAARESFEGVPQLVTLNSRYAPDAYARMLPCQLHGQQRVQVATYYYHRKVYVGAVNRAQFVLANYLKPRSGAALVVLVKAYDAMG